MRCASEDRADQAGTRPDDFRAYSMRQWRQLPGGGLEPLDFRTVPLTITSSGDLEDEPDNYMVTNLSERPVTATRLRLTIQKNQLANIELANLDDIFIYIYSQAYQRQ